MKATLPEVKRRTKNTIEAREPARPGHRPVMTDKEIIEDQAEQIRVLKCNVKRWKGMYEKAMQHGERWAEAHDKLRAQLEKQRGA